MPKLMRPTRSGWRLSQGALVKRSEKQGPDPCSASTHGGGGGQRKRQHCLRTALVTAIFVTAITSGAAACWHPLNTKLGSLHLEPGESSMPTDVLAALVAKRAAERKAAADQRAFLLLIPMIVCLASIIFAITSPTFAAAVAAIGLE